MQLLIFVQPHERLNLQIGIDTASQAECCAAFAQAFDGLQHSDDAAGMAPCNGTAAWKDGVLRQAIAQSGMDLDSEGAILTGPRLPGRHDQRHRWAADGAKNRPQCLHGRIDSDCDSAIWAL